MPFVKYAQNGQPNGSGQQKRAAPGWGQLSENAYEKSRLRPLRSPSADRSGSGRTDRSR